MLHAPSRCHPSPGFSPPSASAARGHVPPAWADTGFKRIKLAPGAYPGATLFWLAQSGFNYNLLVHPSCSYSEPARANCLFLGVIAWMFDHNAETRNALLTKIVEHCLLAPRERP